MAVEIARGELRQASPLESVDADEVYGLRMEMAGEGYQVDGQAFEYFAWKRDLRRKIEAEAKAKQTPTSMSRRIRNREYLPPGMIVLNPQEAS